MEHITRDPREINDNLNNKIYGRVMFVSKDDSGEVEILRHANLALDSVYAHAINCLREGTSITRYIDKISLGRGGHSAGNDKIPIPPEHDDNALEDEIDPPGKKPIAGRQSATSYDVEFNTTFIKAEANEVITEAGLWLDDDTLLCRVTFPSFEKTDQLNLIVRWFLYYTII